MQIHEITKTQLDEGLGSWAGNLAGKAAAKTSAFGQWASPVSDFKSAMADPKRQQQIKMLSDKVYRGWKAYEKTLLQSNPDARETGMYEQALLAFVVKNLLGNQYLPNVINKDKITALVKQLSASGQGSATQTPTTKNPPAEPVFIGGKKLDPNNPNDAKLIAAANAQGQVQEASLPDAIKGNIQQWKDTFKGSTPAPNTTATAAPKTPVTPPPKPPTPPKPPAAPAGTLNPQKEKDLWLQLTQQAAVATAHAPGTGGDADNSKNSNNPSTGDARTYAQQLKPADPAVAQGLAAFGGASAKNIGNTNVKSTGNPIADALLLLAGFRGI